MYNVQCMLVGWLKGCTPLNRVDRIGEDTPTQCTCTLLNPRKCVCNFLHAKCYMWRMHILYWVLLKDCACPSNSSASILSRNTSCAGIVRGGSDLRSIQLCPHFAHKRIIEENFVFIRSPPLSYTPLLKCLDKDAIQGREILIQSCTHVAVARSNVNEVCWLVCERDALLEMQRATGQWSEPSWRWPRLLLQATRPRAAGASAKLRQWPR